jgi:hypothetical protein
LLRAAKQSAASGNGLYAYASASTFQSSTFLASNDWVDMVFTTR